MSNEDAAQALELKQWEFNNASRPVGPITYEPDAPGYGPAECIECGDDMPEVRRRYGFKMCVHCKSRQEANSR